MAEQRLIDANAVLKKMQNWNTKERLINCVEDAPTVSALEVVHGRWERNEHDKIVCSVCKNEPLLDDFGHWKLSAYCPHCGAKMDGGNEDV